MACRITQGRSYLDAKISRICGEENNTLEWLFCRVPESFNSLSFSIMARHKKLKAALDRYKGVDYKLVHTKKLQKEAKKRKQNRSSKISELREEEYMMSGALTSLKEKKEPVFEGKENGKKPAQNEAAADEENLWDTEDEDDDDEDEQDEGLEVPRIRSRLKSLISKLTNYRSISQS